MHQITFTDRAPSGLAGGAHSAPQTPSWIEGSPLLREGDVKGVQGGENRGREERGVREGEGGQGKGRGREG